MSANGGGRGREMKKMKEEEEEGRTEDEEEGEGEMKKGRDEGGKEVLEETEHRWEEVEEDEEDDEKEEEDEEEEEEEEEDDVVVIDTVPSPYASLSSFVVAQHPQQQQQSPPPSPKLQNTELPKQSTTSEFKQSIPANPPSAPPQSMDPPPKAAASSPEQKGASGAWFSPASFLPSGADDQNQSQPGSMPSAQAGAQRLAAELRQRYQPWSVFFSCAKFACPPGVAALGPRIKRNLATFTSNYLCLFAVLLLYCVLTSLLMLLTLIVLGGLLYSVYQFTKRGPVLIGAYEVPPSLLYTLALMLSIPFFWLADAGSVMYWVLGSGMFLMLAHSTFYASEEVPGSEFEVVVTA